MGKPRISVAAAKAKGKKLQQTVRDAILDAFPALAQTDVRSCPMGSCGDDIQLSAAAREAFPFAVECKARARGYSALYDHLGQADRGDSRTAIAVVKQDRCKPLVVISLADFMRIAVRSAND